MTLQKILATLFAVALSATAAYGQYDFGGFTPSTQGATAQPWDSFHLNPKVHVQLDFRNASPDAVIQTFSQASGITIIKDPTLTTGITLQSPKPQTLTDAFAMLNAVLGLKNFQIQKQDNFLLIKANAPAGRFPTGPSAFPGIGSSGPRGGNDSVLRVYQIKYASATNLATTINALYTTTANQAAAAAAAALQGAGGAVPGGFGGPGGNGGYGGRRGGGGGGGGGGTSTVTASADDFSNSLIVNAPIAQQNEIASIIQQVDHATSQPQVSQVYKLQYATASNLITIVQNILSGTTPTGRGASTSRTTANQGGGGRFGFFGGFGGGNNNQNSNGTVTADTLSNSLIVTTTTDDQSMVAQVLSQLDKPAHYESTSFVYVLKNARADVVANLLNEAFGNRTTNGPTGGSLTNTGASQPAVTVTRSTSSTSATSGNPTLTGNGANFGGNNTNSNVNRTNSQTTQTTSLDTEGHVVNVRDLTNNVLLIPNVDTNSIVVVTLPEDRPILENILDQMDQTPEQVMIQTLVVEANLDKEDQLGVEWSFMQGKAFGLGKTTGSGSSLFGTIPPSSSIGAATNTVPSGLNYTLTGPGYQAFLQAISTDTRFDVLSTPRIFTSNNATAQINISQAIPYITSSTQQAAGLAPVLTYSFLNVGIVLTVTPRITSSGSVTMDVDQTANELAKFVDIGNGQLAPEINQREATTTVNVKDGETIVLGGIITGSITDTVNKVPILGDIPLIGSLFRSTDKINDKTELLVFMTPHIIRNAQEARALAETTYDSLGKSTKAFVKLPSPPPLDLPAPASLAVPGSIIQGGTGGKPASDMAAPTPGTPEPPAAEGPASAPTAPVPDNGTATPTPTVGAAAVPGAVASPAVPAQ